MRDLESLGQEELIQIIVDQHRLIEQLRTEIEQLKKRGSTAPFSKGTRKTGAKSPGRKPGQGYFRFRTAPEQAEEEVPIVVPVADACCPGCGGALGEAHQEIVSTTDIPAAVVPEVRLYAVQARQCLECGKSVRGQHPDIATGQQGATAHRVGPRVKALAHILHYGPQAQPNADLIPG
jgi:transposase